MDETLKRCTSCGEWKPATTEYFYEKRDRLEMRCKACRLAAMATLRGVRDANGPNAFDPDITKRCTKCGRELPATPEFYHRHRASEGGLNTRCIACRKADNEADRRARGIPPRIYADPNITAKRCPKCGCTYPREMFRVNTARGNGLAVWCKHCEKNYRARNAVRLREYSRAYYAANREALLQYKKEYYTENTESISHRGREYRRRNADRIASRRHAYYRVNQEQFLVYVLRRRARKRSLPDTFTADDWQAALDHFGGCCAACGRPPGLWHTIAADHWIPLSSPDCPGTVPWNMVPLCHSQKDGEAGCNQSKLDRDPAAWLRARFGPRRGAAIQRRIEDWLNSRR